MLLKFAIKRNVYGNRHYIAIDTENKIYSKQPSSWMCKGDFIEITKTALRQIEDKAKSNNYTYVDSL